MSTTTESTNIVKIKRKYIRKPKLIIEEAVEEEVINTEPEDDVLSLSSIEVEPTAVEETEEEAELELPVLESDPITLRNEIADLKAEVIRLTKFNQDLQRRLEGQRKEPKTKENKEKELKKGKRKVNRAKRPEDYAQRYMEMGQVLKWTHIARNTWAEATYVGSGKFSAKFSYTDEEYEGLSLHAVGTMMSKHLSIRGVNAWTSFKNIDGTSVANLDIQA